MSKILLSSPIGKLLPVFLQLRPDLKKLLRLVYNWGGILNKARHPYPKSIKIGLIRRFEQS